ncbi:MAG: choice-of-anchor V domain-containing protein [Bacteroidota bacterium]
MKKIQPIYAVFFLLTFLYAFSNNPPSQTTGAPDERNCTRCHGPGNATFTGAVALQGLPEVVIPNTTYKVSIVTKATQGSPSRAGFQMVVLDGEANNAGNLTNAEGGARIRTIEGKNYVEHSPAQSFSGQDSVVWTVDWTAPSTIASDSIKIYINSILGNGSGSSNDLMVSNQITRAFQTAIALPVEITIEESNDLSCFGANDGSARVSANGGTGDITYQWSIGDSTGASISGLSIGRYVVTATDSEGMTSTATITINQPDEIVVSVDSITNVTCSSPIGSATAVISSGGVAPFTYLWDNGDTTATSNVLAGMRSVTVTDANQCMGTTTVNINEDNRAPIAFAGSDITVTCADENQATVQLDAFNTSAGTGVSYLWTTADGNIVSGDTTLAPVVDASGTYILTVTNGANGCTAADTTTVTFNTTLPTADAGMDQVLGCDDTNTVTLDGSGSSEGEAITYTWSTTDGTIISGSNTNMATVSGAGTYVLTVNNAATDCSATDTVLITQDATLPEVNLGGNVQIGCTDSDTLQVTATASTGDNITYAWTTADGTIFGDSTTLNLTIIGAGTYTLTATDTSTNCSASASFIATAVTPPTADAGTSDTLKCVDDTLILDGSESEGDNLVYNWTTTDGSILDGNNAIMATINAAGTYTLTVSDTITGCDATASVMISQLATDDLFAASGDAMQLTCANNTITLNGNGSTGNNIVYLWTTQEGNITEGASTLTPTIDAPGRYFLTVTDTITGCSAASSINISQEIDLPVADAGMEQTINCTNTTVTLDGSADRAFNLVYAWTTNNGNIVSGADTPTPTVSAGGTYFLTVVDTLTSCTSLVDSIVVMADAALPTVDVGTNLQLDCNTDTLTLMGSASIGENITTVWSTDDGNIIGDAGSLMPMVDAGGMYTLTVTDTVSGCTNSASIMVVVDTTTPTVVVGATEQLLCAGANLIINGMASGGTNFAYSWSTSDGSIASDEDSATVAIDSAGLFELMVINEDNGCATTASVMVTSVESPTIALDTINDSLVLVVTGGTMPYTYDWTGDEISVDSSLADLSNGDYSVTVTDANGCTDNLQFTIDMPSSIYNLSADIDNLQVYPNPAYQQFEINLAFHEVQTGSILIMNKVGQQVWQQPFADKTINFAIEVTDWTSGVYYMLIQTERGVRAEEIVVVK